MANRTLDYCADKLELLIALIILPRIHTIDNKNALQGLELDYQVPDLVILEAEGPSLGFQQVWQHLDVSSSTQKPGSC